MLNLYMYCGLFMFFIGGFSLCLKKDHFLLMLMSLELIGLSLYFMFFIWFLMLTGGYSFSMIYLCMVVCEGSLGLSILVNLSYSCGNDYFQSLNILW